MNQAREQQRQQRFDAAVANQQAARDLSPQRRPTTEMLAQFEQNSSCAQLFFAEATGFDVHHDVFPGEVASVNLEPGWLLWNRAARQRFIELLF